jgi:hypothetical protein
MPSDVLVDVPEETGIDSVEVSMAMVEVAVDVMMAEVAAELLLEVSTSLWTWEEVVDEVMGGITSVVLTDDTEVVVIMSGDEEDDCSVVDSLVTTSAEVGDELTTWEVTVVVTIVVTNSETTLTLEFSAGLAEPSLSFASCRLCRCSSTGRCSWAFVLCSAG